MYRPKTIARTRTKHLEEIFSNVKEANSFRLDHNFQPVSLTVEQLKRVYFVTYEDLKLVQKGPEEFGLRIHSNYWIEFTTTKAID